MNLVLGATIHYAWTNRLFKTAFPSNSIILLLVCIQGVCTLAITISWWNKILNRIEQYAINSTNSTSLNYHFIYRFCWIILWYYGGIGYNISSCLRTTRKQVVTLISSSTGACKGVHGNVRCTESGESLCSVVSSIRHYKLHVNLRCLQLICMREHSTYLYINFLSDVASYTLIVQ